MANVEVYDAAYIEALEASVVIGGSVNSAGQLVLTRGNGEQFNAGQVVAPLDTRWPIGSVFQSFEVTDPATLLGGGTWTRLKDRMLIGVGDNPRWDSVGEQGGAETVAITVNQMPSHDHGTNTGTESSNHTHTGTALQAGGHSHTFPQASGTQVVNAENGQGNAMDNNYNAASTDGAGDHTHAVSLGNQDVLHTHPIAAQGGGQGHENMPPFTAVYMWRRTA